MIDVLNTEFVTYGFKVETDKILPITYLKEDSIYINKPTGCGLWGSPVNSTYGWKDWCEEESFRTETFKCHSTWKLKPSAKIRIVDSYEDLLDLVDNYGGRRGYGIYYIDFFKLSKDYDGMFLTEKGMWECRVCAEYKGGSIGINTWDCESIVIWNKDIVEVLSYKENL